MEIKEIQEFAKENGYHKFMVAPLLFLYDNIEHLNGSYAIATNKEKKWNDTLVLFPL